MRVEWIAYTRKDFTFPLAQKFPHRDPMEEVSGWMKPSRTPTELVRTLPQAAFLKKYFPEGSAFIMGPVTGDHWFVFVADYVDRPTTECIDRTLDVSHCRGCMLHITASCSQMMMFGIDEEVAKLFVKDAKRFPKDSEVTRASGISTLLPGSNIQEFCFEPCGYSMNGLLYDSYWTIHITPESHCSYASFETNIRMRNYSSLIKAVLAIFRPKRFTMTLFADEHGLRQLRETPFQSVLPVPIAESTAEAIAGPCVLVHDPQGEMLMKYLAPPAGAVYDPIPEANNEGNGNGNGTAKSGSPPPPEDMNGSAPAVNLSNGTGTSTGTSTDSAQRRENELPDTPTRPGPEAASTTTAHPQLPVAGAPSPADAALLGAQVVQLAAAINKAAADSPRGTSLQAVEDNNAPVVPVMLSVPKPPAIKRLPSYGASSSQSAPLALAGKRGAATYVMTNKCNTEFVGEYVCMLGNFTLVHTSTATGTGVRSSIQGEVPDAAREMLAMPRAKYVVMKKVQALQNRLRTESV
jgi:S-adenosylmethionine decarboxylase